MEYIDKDRGLPISWETWLGRRITAKSALVQREINRYLLEDIGEGIIEVMLLPEWDTLFRINGSLDDLLPIVKRIEEWEANASVV